jgi:hypothetical protein
MARIRRGSDSLRPIVWLVLLPLVIAVLTLAFLGLALWELALLLWQLTIRTSRTIRPGPRAAGDITSAGPGESAPGTSDPMPFVPAPREPADDSSRQRALAPGGTTGWRPRPLLPGLAAC